MKFQQDDHIPRAHIVLPPHCFHIYYANRPKDDVCYGVYMPSAEEVLFIINQQRKEVESFQGREEDYQFYMRQEYVRFCLRDANDIFVLPFLNDMMGKVLTTMGMRFCFEAILEKQHAFLPFAKGLSNEEILELDLGKIVKMIEECPMQEQLALRRALHRFKT